MNAGDEMVQVVKIMYQGTEFLLRISGTLFKETAMLIAALLHKQGEKPSVGKTSLIKFLQDGDAIKVLRFNQKDLTRFCKLSKDFGFPIVPIKNRNGDELCNVLVREKDAEQINAALSEMGFAKMQPEQESEKNIKGTPPKSYSNGQENSLNRRKNEALRIGESAGQMPLLQTGDQQHGDFIPAYCYPPEPVVIYADPPRPIPLLGDGMARGNAPDIIYAQPADRKSYLDKSLEEKQPESIVLPESEYQILEPSIIERQKHEPVVFLQNEKTGRFELFTPSLYASYRAQQQRRPDRSIPQRERKPSVKVQLAHFAAKIREQAKEIPALQKNKER